VGSRKRWPAVVGGTLVVATMTVVLLLLYLSRKDYTEDFRERRGVVERVSVEEYAADSVSRRFWVRIASSSGLTVTCGMLIPRPAGKQYPVIVLLGGKATGRYAVDYALGVDNVIVVAPDYPYEPRDDYSLLRFVGDVPAIRSAIFDMVPSVMLATDYLWGRPDVDTTKLILMGYSFGAPFIPAIIAQDRRAAIAVVVYGGGDVASLIRHNVQRYEGALAGYMAGWLSRLLLYPLEPLRFIDGVSPIPLLMINGTEDEQVPRENTEMLFDGARAPKEIVWIESRHVHPRNMELTKRIIGTIRVKLAERGMVQPVPSR
jgi:dienelactone hydrolase